MEKNPCVKVIFVFWKHSLHPGAAPRRHMFLCYKSVCLRGNKSYKLRMCRWEPKYCQLLLRIKYNNN